MKKLFDWNFDKFYKWLICSNTFKGNLKFSYSKKEEDNLLKNLKVFSVLNESGKRFSNFFPASKGYWKEWEKNIYILAMVYCEFLLPLYLNMGNYLYIWGTDPFEIRIFFPSKLLPFPYSIQLCDRWIIDIVCRHSRGGQISPENNIADLEYANDVVLFSWQLRQITNKQPQQD